MKLLTLSCVLVYAFLFASPPLHCHGLEASAGHEDHCQGCLCTVTSSEVLDKSSAPRPTLDASGSTIAGSEHGYCQIRHSLLRSRAPPLLPT